MTQPKTIEGREYTKFLESTTRPNSSMVEVFVANADESGDYEQDFADGNISAVKAIYKTLSGVALANNDSTEENVSGIFKISKG